MYLTYFRQNIQDISNLLVIGYDPSHSKSAQVSLDLKILSILARTNIHHKKMKLNEDNQYLNANQLSKMYFLENNKNDERLETIQHDDFDFQDGEDDGSDFEFEGDMDLNIEVRNCDINNDFNIYNKE